MNVYGIPMFATSKWSAEKLNHVASILAELLDNDEDGCADDPKVLNWILTDIDGLSAAVLLPNNEDDVESAEPILEAAGRNNIIAYLFCFLWCFIIGCFSIYNVLIRLLLHSRLFHCRCRG